jgi:ABC-type uncharacterized transport system auxiliary subunit
MRRFGLLAATLASLTGCLGSAPPVPRDHYYRVLVAPPTRNDASQRAFEITFPGVLSVAPLDADGLLRERPLLYSSTGRPHEMQQHDYHYWMDPPPRMLQVQLVDFLRQTGVAKAVITPDLRVRPDYEVTGRIKRLERLLGGGPPRVVAEIELAMVQTERSQLVVVETYSAEVPAADESVEASVLALDQALTSIFERFMADASWSYTAFRSTPLD